MSDEQNLTFDQMVNQLREILNDGAGSYEASADAMWRAAKLVFNHVASEVGATGFQASWAALRFYGEVMHKTSPFMVIDLENALYPQYDLHARLSEFIEENRGYLREEAAKKLGEFEQRPTMSYTDDDGVEHTSWTAHPDVVAHWRLLAEAVSA